MIFLWSNDRYGVYSLQVNGGNVEWRFYENLYRQESQSILRLCPKLTERHVNIPDSMKMRVSFATQVI